MPATLIECVADRTGERLIQGLLRFLLDNDADFANAFCSWAQWPASVTTVREECADGCHRHDLVLTFENGQRRNIELKLWAGLTDSQSRDSQAIDLFIVPERYSGGVPRDKAKSWESLNRNVVSKSALAKRILAGFEEYTWTGGSLPLATLQREVQNWIDGTEADWRGRWFLKGCNDCLDDHDLNLHPSNATKLLPEERLGYWGYYLRRPVDQGTDRWLWNGIIFSYKASLEVAYIVQISQELSRLLGCRRKVMPPWYPREHGATGVRIEAQDGIFSVEGWWNQVGDVLKEYDGMKA